MNAAGLAAGHANRPPVADAADSDDVLRRTATTIADALDDLARVSSAARYGDQLAAIIVDAHATGFARLLALVNDRRVLVEDYGLAEVLWLHEAASDSGAIDTMAARLDTLRSSIAQSGVPGLVDAADRLIEAVLELHGWALSRCIELLHQDGQSSVLTEAVGDEIISALLLAHGMYPVPLAERLAHVLDACSGALGENAGQIDVLEVSESTGHVRLRISGGDDRQRWRIRLVVERAVHDLVADVVQLDIEGAESEPRVVPGTTFVPLSSIQRKRPTRWVEVPGLLHLADGEILRVQIDGDTVSSVALVACRVGRDYFVALDPFGHEPVRLTQTDPPTIEATGGQRLVLSTPLSTHISDGVVEVLLSC